MVDIRLWISVDFRGSLTGGEERRPTDPRRQMPLFVSPPVDQWLGKGPNKPEGRDKLLDKNTELVIARVAERRKKSETYVVSALLVPPMHTVFIGI